MAQTIVSLKPTPETARYLRKLQATLSPGELRAGFTPFMDRQSSIAAGRISKNMLSGQRLRRRTGSLARGVIGRAEQGGSLPGMRVGILRGPALAYAGAQEEGADIFPKNAKALAIPQAAALTAAGVDRFGGPRKYPGQLRLVPFRRSGIAVAGLYDEKSMLAAEKADGEVDLSRATLLYILVKRVTIKPKHYLRDGFAQFLPDFAEALAAFVRDLLLGRGGRGKR